MNTINKFIIQLLFISLFFNISYSSQIDSLKNLLEKSTGKERIELLIELGELIVKPQPNEALKLGNEALELSLKLDSRSSIASSNQLIGKAYYRLKIYDKAEQNQKISFQIFKSLNDSAKMAALYDNLGDTYEKSGRIDSAILIFEKALMLFKAVDDRKNEALSNSSLGMLFWRKGQNSEALKYHYRAYEIRKELNIQSSIAMSANNIGVVHWRLGNYQKALEHYTESLSIRERIGDSTGIVVTSNNIGYIYLKLNHFDKAQSGFEKSLKASKELGYTFGVAYSNHLLSILYLQRKEFQKSIQASLEAITHYHEAYELNSVAYSMIYLGEAYAGLGNFSKAKEIFYAALDTARKANDKFSLATTYYSFAKINYEQEDLTTARKNLDNALEIAYQENFIDLIIDGSFLYSRIMKKVGEHAKALEYYENYMQALNNLRLEQLSTNVSEWELKYQENKRESELYKLREDNKLKEAEIEKEKIFRNWLAVTLLIMVLFVLGLLRYYYFKRKVSSQLLLQKDELERLNQKLSQINISLEEDVRMKDRLFSVIAHDLKGPFNSLLNYSEILISETDSLTTQQISDYSRIVYKASKVLLEVTENLLHWSRLQVKKLAVRKETVDLYELISSVIDFESQYAKSKNIAILIISDQIVHFKSDREMLHTILRNLISNSIKFSHPNSKVTIKLSKYDRLVEISIQDNGVGIASERLNRIFSVDDMESTLGTNNEKGTGIGLVICKEFVEALSGTIKAASEVGVGSTFTISFPIE